MDALQHSLAASGQSEQQSLLYETKFYPIASDAEGVELPPTCVLQDERGLTFWSANEDGGQMRIRIRGRVHHGSSPIFEFFKNDDLESRCLCRVTLSSSKVKGDRFSVTLMEDVCAKSSWVTQITGELTFKKIA